MTVKKYAAEEIERILHHVRGDRMNPPMGGRAEEDRRTKNDLAAIVEQLQAEAVSEESAHLATIDDRAHYEEAISETARALGCEDEWSNVHDHAKCVVELAEEAAAEIRALQAEKAAMTAGINRVRTLAAKVKALDEINARTAPWSDKEAFLAFNRRYTEAHNAAFAALEDLIGEDETETLYSAQGNCERCAEDSRAEDGD